MVEPIRCKRRGHDDHQQHIHETSADQVRSIVEGYRDAVNSGDRARLIGLFGENGVLFDPYPSGAFEGREGISQWWDTVVAPMSPVQIRIRELHVCADRAAAVTTMTASPSEEITMQLQGVDIFTISQDLTIASVFAYWDPTTATTLA